MVDNDKLLIAAFKVTDAFDALCRCVDEFEDYHMEAEACAEYRDGLDTAILDLKQTLIDVTPCGYYCDEAVGHVDHRPPVPAKGGA